MLRLVCVESSHLSLVWQSEGRWDKVKTLGIHLLTKLHVTCEYILVAENADIWIAIAHLFSAWIDPFKNFLLLNFWMHPSESHLSPATLSPVRLRLYQLLQQCCFMAGILSANTEVGALRTLFLLWWFLLWHDFDFFLLLLQIFDLISCSVHHTGCLALIMDCFDHDLFFIVLIKQYESAYIAILWSSIIKFALSI